MKRSTICCSSDRHWKFSRHNFVKRLSSFTGFQEQGILVRDLSLLKKRYMRSSRFKWDIASLLPTDLLYLKLGIHTPLVRVNRFLRTGRMYEALDRMETRTSQPTCICGPHMVFSGSTWVSSGHGPNMGILYGARLVKLYRSYMC